MEERNIPGKYWSFIWHMEDKDNLGDLISSINKISSSFDYEENNKRIEGYVIFNSNKRPNETFRHISTNIKWEKIKKQKIYDIQNKKDHIKDTVIKEKSKEKMSNSKKEKKVKEEEKIEIKKNKKKIPENLDESSNEDEVNIKKKVEKIKIEDEKDLSPTTIYTEEMYGWQLDVLKILKKKQDGKIYWFWEDKGLYGKTDLARYLVLKHGANSGKNVEELIKRIYNSLKKKEMPKICVLDIPREMKNIDYEKIQEIKDGSINLPDLEEGIFIDRPHFIILANFPPKQSALKKISEGKIVVKNIRED